MKNGLAAWRHRLAAGAVGIVLGGALGFALLGRNDHASPVIILGAFRPERMAMRDSLGSFVSEAERLQSSLVDREAP